MTERGKVLCWAGQEFVQPLRRLEHMRAAAGRGGGEDEAEGKPEQTQHTDVSEALP